jgi:hypothetical protein
LTPVPLLYSVIQQTNADYLQYWHYLDGNWLEAAHKADIGVNSYTVNIQAEFDFSYAKNMTDFLVIILAALLIHR